jgi:ABC-type transporter Mla subunit MlaD
VTNQAEIDELVNQVVTLLQRISDRDDFNGKIILSVAQWHKTIRVISSETLAEALEELELIAADLPRLARAMSEERKPSR